MRKRLFSRVTNAPVAEREDPPEFLKLVVTQEEECKFSLQEFGYFQVFAFPRRVFFLPVALARDRLALETERVGLVFAWVE